MSRRWVGAALVGAMIVATLAVWHGLPERIPTHWNLRGDVDGYSGRRFGAFLVPAIAFAVWALLPLLRRLDPRRENYERFEETFFLIVNSIVLFLGAMHAVILSAALGWRVDMNRVMLPLIGLMFVVLGNFLPRLRSNWWMGVRTPWTLENERVWRETHRLAGWTFVLGGAVAVLATALPAALRFPVGFTALMLGGIVPVVWSYVLWRRYRDEGPEGRPVEG
jgi:uncharacterized membrane protein